MLPALWCFNQILTNIRCTTTATGLRGFKFGLVCHKIFYFLQLFAAFVRARVAAFCSSASPQTRNQILHKSKLLRASGYCTDTARILRGYCTDTARIQHTNCSSIPPGYCTDTARHLPSVSRCRRQCHLVPFPITNHTNTYTALTICTIPYLCI